MQLLRFFKKPVFWIAVISLLLLVSIAVTSQTDEKSGWVDSIISVPLAPFQKAAYILSSKLETAFIYLRNNKDAKIENESLKEQLKALDTEISELERLREENKELREALNLKLQFEGYTVIGANIIARNPDNWLSTLRIDRGTKDGAGVDMPVISAGRGLVGRIVSAGLTTSVVLTITDIESTVWSVLPRTSEQGRLKGDITLVKQGYCKLDYIPPEADLSIGDVVETSGIGGLFPGGLLAGRVKYIRQPRDILSRYAVIDPAVNFKKIDEVFILIPPGD